MLVDWLIVVCLRLCLMLRVANEGRALQPITAGYFLSNVTSFDLRDEIGRVQNCTVFSPIFACKFATGSLSHKQRVQRASVLYVVDLLSSD